MLSYAISKEKYTDNRLYIIVHTNHRCIDYSISHYGIAILFFLGFPKTAMQRNTDDIEGQGIGIKC